MYLTGTRRKGKRIFSAVWMWVSVVVALTRVKVEACEALHPHTNMCHKADNSTVRCDLTDSAMGREYCLDNFQWYDIRKVIIWNANSLELQEPLCSSQKRLVEVYNSARVTAGHGKENCWQQLHLYNCTYVTIEGGINLVKMLFSEADKIELPRVRWFDLQDSLVGEVSVVVDKDDSAITDSKIDVVTKLVINRSVKLNVEDSTLGHVEGFMYNSSNSKSLLKNVTVESVSSNGFLVYNGVLTLDSFIISSVASMGLQVMNGAELILMECEIETIVYDSILVKEGGKIHFKNVTIGQQREIFMSLLDVSTPVYPLAFQDDLSISPSAFIVISLFVGVTVGAMMGLAVMMFIMRSREDSTPKVVTTELHTLENSKVQYADDGPHTQQTPKQGLVQRIPFLMSPKASSLPVKDYTLAKPNKDEWDVMQLPPPPPPPTTDENEELYDEVQGSACPGEIPQAFPVNMSKLSSMNKLFP